MMILLILALIPVAFIAYAFEEASRNKRSLEELLFLKKDESSFKDAVSDFKNLLHGSWYISNHQYQLWKTKYQHLAGMLNPAFDKVKTQDPFKQLILDFSSYWNEGRKFVDGFNERFVKQESPVIKQILNKKEIQNNSDQITAIASDEDNTLLVAGAGTGKTTTILGKLAYLVERVGVKPEEILLLSFTGRPAARPQLECRHFLFLPPTLSEFFHVPMLLQHFTRRPVLQALHKPTVHFPFNPLKKGAGIL